MSFIMDKTVKTFQDMLTRFAPLENGKKVPGRCQLIIATQDNETCEPYYRVLNDFTALPNPKPKEGFIEGQYTFNQLLDTKMDLLGREIIAKPFMAKCLRKFATQFKSDPKNMELMIALAPNKEGKLEVTPILYRSGEELGSLEWETDIFDDKTLMEIGNDFT